ncbi:hypothetical protein AB0D54_15020 [Streptomyces xanthophaeus]|uniref:hypothetical protein n=1 Tax=Streptomyces xanthophaeus TaxID=67385 RepID=UPI00342BB71F
MTASSTSPQAGGPRPADAAANQTPSGFGPPPPTGWQAPAPGSHPYAPYPGTGTGQAPSPYAGAIPCRHCGAAPAVPVTFRLHQGLLIMMRFHKMEGPFCRECGTAYFRELTARTLWQGWWSPFSLVLFTPFTLISNRVALAKVNRLPEPSGGGPRPRVGLPVLRRPTSLVVLLPIAWAIWVIANIINDVTS